MFRNERGLSMPKYQDWGSMFIALTMIALTIHYIFFTPYKDVNDLIYQLILLLIAGYVRCVSKAVENYTEVMGTQR